MRSISAVHEGSRPSRVLSIRRAAAIATIGLAGLVSSPRVTLADEGGVSFWLPGTYGSFAATPLEPGWSLGTIYYHTDVSAGDAVSFARDVELGKVPLNFKGKLKGDLDADANLAFLNLTYVFATPVLGGQASVGLTGIVGGTSSSLSGTLSGRVTAPGGSIPFNRSASSSDSVVGVGDLYPLFSLRWNAGVHNFMTYLTGDIPIGAYDSHRLSNIGLGHGAIDAGGGYTYLDHDSGLEFSFVTGFTYNFENTETNYQNGVDWHFDWGASQFLSEQFALGVAGYFYEQITGDSGPSDRVGSFKSGVIGIGPQITYLLPVFGETHAYLNVKAYGEFDATNRAEGWNVWATVSLPLGGAVF